MEVFQVTMIWMIENAYHLSLLLNNSNNKSFLQAEYITNIVQRNSFVLRSGNAFNNWCCPLLVIGTYMSVFLHTYVTYILHITCEDQIIINAHLDTPI